MLENPSTKKRLLVLASTFPRWNGDTEPRFVLDLSNHLAKYFDVTVLAPFSPGSAVSEQLEDVHVQRFKYAIFDSWSVLASPGSILGNLKRRPWLALLLPIFFISQILTFRRVLVSGNYDAIHVHWIVPQALSFWVARLFLTSPPFIVTVHGGDATVSSLPIIRQLTHHALRSAQAVTVVAEHLRQKVPEATHVIPMGVDLDRFAAVSGEAPPRIVFIGRLARKKGVDLMLQAVESLPKNIEVHIIGEGEERTELEAASNRAYFHGALSHDKVVKFLNCSDVICLPFRSGSMLDTDGTPTVLLEMAAAGLLIVTSDAPAVVQAMNENSVVRFSQNNVTELTLALKRVFSEPALRESTILEAKKAVKDYSWHQIAKLHSKLLSEVA